MFVPSKADAAMIQEQWIGDPGTEAKPSWYGTGFRQALTKVPEWTLDDQTSPTAWKSGAASSSTDPGPKVVPPRDAWTRDRPRIVMPRQPKGRPPAHILPPPPPPKPPNFVYEPPPPPSPKFPPPPKKMPTPPKFPPPPKAPERWEVVKEEEEASVMDYDDSVPDWERAD